MNVCIPHDLVDRPIEYEELERLKRAGYDALQARPPLEVAERLKHTLIVFAMWAQSNRALCPDFSTYVAHVLTAATRPQLDDYFGSEVAGLLLAKFGTVKKSRVGSGADYFYTDYSRRRLP